MGPGLVAVALLLCWSAASCVPDAVFLARCRAGCTSGGERQKCVSECISSTKDKPGQCPKNINRKFDAASIDSCSKDTDCPGVEKCCSHAQGITCQIADNLESVEGLPSIPKIIKINEREKSRSAKVIWQMDYIGSTPVIYVVEVRHHAGNEWSPHKLGNWVVWNKTNKTECMVKNLVPGHFYQVRVAAVNEIGSRGFSNPTKPVSLDAVPEIPKRPKNIKVTKIGWLNGTMYGVLSWDAPESDLPIQKYRVICNTLADTLEVQQATVSNKKTSYILKQLKSDTEYYIQVHALSQFGQKRLKGENGSIHLNTTLKKSENYDWKNYFNNHFKHNKTSGNHGLRSNGFFWQDGKLQSRIVWKPLTSPHSRYLLTWNPTSSCNASSKHKQIEIKSQKPTNNIFNLMFNCKYKVILQEVSRHVRKLGIIHITSPPCEQYKGKPGNIFC